MRLPVHSKRAWRNQSGFTLVELLIATLSFAVILTALNTTFYAAMRLRDRATKNVENLIPLNQAAAIIKRDLRGILPTNTLAGPLLGQPPGAVKSGSGYLEFYTSSGVVSDGRDWGEVQKVAYYLRRPEFQTDQTNGLELVRAITRNLLPATTQDLEEMALLTGLETLEFSFFDGAAWQTSWDSTTTATPLPQAVRISVQRMGENYRLKANEPLVFVMPISTQARTNQTTGAGSPGSASPGGR